MKKNKYDVKNKIAEKKTDFYYLSALVFLPLVVGLCTFFFDFKGFIISVVLLFIPELELLYFTEIYLHIIESKKTKEKFDSLKAKKETALVSIPVLGILGIFFYLLIILLSKLNIGFTWFINNLYTIVLILGIIAVVVLFILVLVKIIPKFINWNKNKAIEILGEKNVK